MRPGRSARPRSSWWVRPADAVGRLRQGVGYWLRQAREDGDPDPDKSDRDHRQVTLDDGFRGTGLLSGELTPLGKAEVRSARAGSSASCSRPTGPRPARPRRGGRPPPTWPAPPPSGATTPWSRWPAAPSPPPPAASGPAAAHHPRRYDALRNVLELADGTLISPANVADLLDQAIIETMLFEGPSRVLDLGHQRSFVGAARRAVEVVHRTGTGGAATAAPTPARSTTSSPPASAAPPCLTTAGPNAGPTTANTTGPPQPRRDHHPTPTATTASPAPPTSTSPAPASATDSSTTPPGAPSPPTAGRSRRDARLPAMTDTVTVDTVLHNRMQRAGRRAMDRRVARASRRTGVGLVAAGRAAVRAGTEAYVAPATLADGTAAVLKVLLPWPGGPPNHESAVLRLAGGHGLVRLLRHDDARGALLLEALGTPLDQARPAHDPSGSRSCATSSPRLWGARQQGARRGERPLGLTTRRRQGGLARPSHVTDQWEGARASPAAGPPSTTPWPPRPAGAEAHDDRAGRPWSTATRTSGTRCAILRGGHRLRRPRRAVRRARGRSRRPVPRGPDEPDDPMRGDPGARAQWLADRTGLDAEAASGSGASSSGCPQGWRR